eukprot:scaffold235758_cov17-Tisochrysis_lutea.AAC.1
MRVALQEQLQILNPLGCCEFAWSLMPAFHIHKWGVFMFDWLQAFLEEKAAKAAAAKAESERARIEIEERAYAQAVAHERKMAGIRERDMAHGQQIKEQMATQPEYVAESRSNNFKCTAAFKLRVQTGLFSATF